VYESTAYSCKEHGVLVQIFFYASAHLLVSGYLRNDMEPVFFFVAFSSLSMMTSNAKGFV